MSVLQSELKLSSAEFAGNEKSMGALTAESNILNNKLVLQTEKVNEMRKALENAKQNYGENSNQVKDWQIKLNNAETQLVKVRDEVSKNAQAIRELSSQERELEKTKTAFEKIKDAVHAANKKLDDAGEYFHKLKGKVSDAHDKLEKAENVLKKVGSISLKGLTAGAAAATTVVAGLGTSAVAAGKQIYDMASEAAAAGDAIDEASQRMRLSSSDYQELTYAAKMSGVELTTLETAAKTLQKSGSNLDLSKAINQVASIKDESARAEKAVELFGSKAAYSMGPMLSQGVEGIDKLKTAAQEYNLVMSEKAVEASAKFNDSLDNLTGTTTAIKNNLSAEFLPGITEIMDGLTGVFMGDEGATDMIIGGVDDIIGSFESIAPKLAVILGTLAETASEIAPDVINSLVSGLTGNIDKVSSTALDIVSSFGSTILEEDNLNSIVNAGVDIVVKLGGGLLDSLPVLISAGFTIVSGLTDALLEDENMDKIVASALDIVVTLSTGLIGSAPQLLEAGWELISALVEALWNYDWGAVGAKIWSSIKNSLFGGAEDEAKKGNSHAVGLNYVPYDNYSAVLHQGEAVLTAAENKAYKAQKNASAAASAADAQEIKALRKDVQQLTKTIQGGVNINNTREVARELDKRVKV